ncbi:MAG: hypothetical protein MJZ76_01575 [Bacteroidales bacterium]|nr:hypothetical protein [Bacteroidales bacterium]
MKRFLLTAIICCLFAGFTNTVCAQAPYKQSIGITAGNMQAVSYKVFFTDHLALQADLGTKITLATGDLWNWPVWTVELNPNLMYEGSIIPGLFWFAGGGVSLGYCWNITNLGKFGVNAIGGLEYKFGNIPLTLQFDFRPGYGLLFNTYGTANYFDWGINAGVRYTF